jgi:HTH-type transcriptional regulator/antitoxin HigA
MVQALPKRQGLNMTSSTPSLDVKALTRTWAAFDRVARLRPIRNDAEYDRTVAMMNSLLDVVGDQEDHALAGLLDLVSELVADYDASHHAIEASEPREVLRYLIEQRGLKQSDLADIVPQSNLSAILAGKRKISAAMAGKLAKYFNVSAAVFINS